MGWILLGSQFDVGSFSFAQALSVSGKNVLTFISLSLCSLALLLLKVANAIKHQPRVNSNQHKTYY